MKNEELHKRLDLYHTEIPEFIKNYNCFEDKLYIELQQKLSEKCFQELSKYNVYLKDSFKQKHVIEGSLNSEYIVKRAVFDMNLFDFIIDIEYEEYEHIYYLNSNYMRMVYQHIFNDKEEVIDKTIIKKCHIQINLQHLLEDFYKIEKRI